MDNQSEAIKNVYLHEDGKAVIIIDQTKLPTVTEYLTLGTAKDLYDAIFELKVRGAPAIGICAAFGMYVLAGTIETGDYDEFLKKFRFLLNVLFFSENTQTYAAPNKQTLLPLVRDSYKNSDRRALALSQSRHERFRFHMELYQTKIKYC